MTIKIGPSMYKINFNQPISDLSKFFVLLDSSIIRSCLTSSLIIAGSSGLVLISSLTAAGSLGSILILLLIISNFFGSGLISSLIIVGSFNSGLTSATIFSCFSSSILVSGIIDFLVVLLVFV